MPLKAPTCRLKARPHGGYSLLIERIEVKYIKNSGPFSEVRRGDFYKSHRLGMFIVFLVAPGGR
jgi:hypothetical protein